VRLRAIQTIGSIRFAPAAVLMEPDKNKRAEQEKVFDDNGELGCWLQALKEIVERAPPKSVPDPPVAVLPWLYLAPISCVRNNGPKLQELGITHVLSTNAMTPNASQTLYYELLEHQIDHCYIAALDILQYNMMEHWDECREFLQQAKEQAGGKVLVHCDAGINRSGTVAAAAMMYFGEMDLLDVMRQLKAQRGHIMSNASFQKQLVQFASRQGRLGPKPEGNNTDSPKIVAVTGAPGFIGAHLCHNLVQHGYHVRACVRANTVSKTEHLLAMNSLDTGGCLTIHQADMMVEGVYDKIFEGVYGVFHVAGNFGTDPRWQEAVQANNDETTETGAYSQGVYDSYIRPLQHLLESVRKSRTVRRVVYTSSQCVGPWVSKHENIYETIQENPYGKGKEECEKYLYDFGKEHDIRCFSSVPCEVLGPLLTVKHDHVYPHRLAGILAGKWPATGGWCVADVRDVADTQRRMFEAADRLANGTRFYNGADRSLVGQDLFRQLREEFPEASSRMRPPPMDEQKQSESEDDEGSAQDGSASSSSSYGESAWDTEGITRWSDPENVLSVVRHAVNDTIRDTVHSSLAFSIPDRPLSVLELKNYYNVAEMDGEEDEMAWYRAELDKRGL